VELGSSIVHPYVARDDKGNIVGTAYFDTHRVRTLDETLLVVDGLFALGLLIVLLQVFLVPEIPWLGLPIVRVLEVYGLLVAPHLIGVLVRRHRLELSKIYVLTGPRVRKTAQ